MESTLLLVLKYVTWALTVGTAFAGSWLFEFTKVDKDTGKRTLTTWGRRGIVFAGLSLVCAFILTVWMDREATRKQANAASQIAIKEQQIDEERNEAIRFRDKFDASLADTNRMAQYLVKEAERRKSEERPEVVRILEQLITRDDLKQKYPTTELSITKIAGARVLSEADKRISRAGICQNLPLTREKIDDLPSAIFPLRSNSQQQLTLLVSSDGAMFQMMDGTRANNLSNGYSFIFSDDTESPRLTCSDGAYKSDTFCGESTATSSGAKLVYELLQRKPVAKVKTDRQIFAVDPASSQAILKTFSCVKP